MKNVIFRIVLSMLSIVFSQIEPMRAEAAVVIERVDTLLPVPGPNGEKDWYAMPKSRLVRIAERLDSLTLTAALVPPLDSALIECKELVVGKNNQIKKLQEQVRSLDEIAAAKDAIIQQREKQAKICLDAYAVLEKKHKKKTKALRRWVRVAGIVTIALVTTIIVLAVK